MAPASHRSALSLLLLLALLRYWLRSAASFGAVVGSSPTLQKWLAVVPVQLDVGAAAAHEKVRIVTAAVRDLRVPASSSCAANLSRTALRQVECASTNTLRAAGPCTAAALVTGASQGALGPGHACARRGAMMNDMHYRYLALALG